ncbi:MAG: UvrD-helicase domain-containing protein [Candidatus Sericytochromatia bacterium]|nr:UvrD-helicase domain-containing protein [Candidatus Tanganyikabacteria bacterium]
MATEWTVPQAAAIRADDPSVLVSAGAGAGKTAVLVERILQAALAPGKPLPLNRLLVVTFTDAAAREMRHRLDKALADLARAEPDNPLIRDQRQRLERAWMSTLHAFCQRVVRRWGLAVGVAPDTRLLDEGEAGLYLAKAIERTLELALADDDPDLASCLDASAPDGDRLLRAALAAGLERLLSLPDPDGWLAMAASDHAESPEGTAARARWWQTLALDLQTRLEAASSSWRQWSRDLEETGLFPAQAAHGLGIADGLARAAGAIGGCSGPDHAGIAEVAAALALPRAPATGRQDDKEVWAVWADRRSRLQAQVRGLREHLLADPDRAHEGNTAQDMASSQTRGFIRLLGLLLRTHATRKREAGVMDFGDLEHLALTILDPDCPGGAEALAALRGRFDQVMVDEVQDTNPIQEALLDRLLAEGEGRPAAFLVGDVKQAIYGFRMADPALFLARLDAADPEGSQGARRIDLPHNFRSRANLLEACNGLFGHLFDRSVGGLDYDDREILLPGARYPESPQPRAHWVTVAAEEGVATQDAQAIACAQVIRQLLDDGGEGSRIWEKDAYRQAHPGDFAVLVRDGAQIERVRQALAACGIPSMGSLRAGWFDTPEIAFMRDLLHVIDNPRHDRPLLRIARSTLGRMTDQDLADLRVKVGHGPFHKSLLDLPTETAEPDTALSKARALGSFLEPWRRTGRRLAAADLIERLLDHPAILEAIAHEGPTPSAPANLDVLLQRARVAGQGVSRGLNHFLTVLGEMEAGQSRVDRPVMAEEQAAVVRVMTIHASKGLQFPIVLVPGLDRNFPMRESREAFQIHRHAGIATRYRDPLDGSTRETPSRLAVAQASRRDALAEEIRVLYVAMTRAMESLYLLAPAPSSPVLEQAIATARSGVMNLTLRQALRCGSWQAMMAPFLLRHARAATLHHHWSVDATTSGQLLALPPCAPGAWAFRHETVGLAPPADPEPPAAAVSREREPSPMPYAWEAATRTPAKQKVTGLHAGTASPKPHKVERLAPLFMQGPERIPGPAELGQALHMVLQHLSLDTPPDEAPIRDLIARLGQIGQISEVTARHLQPSWLAWWLQSPLARHARETGGVLHREVPFTLTADRLGLVAPNEDAPLIQGIIDAVLETADAVEVWDYKTDAPGKRPLEDLVREHRTQVAVYARAAALLFRKPDRAAHLVFLAHGQIVKI